MEFDQLFRDHLANVYQVLGSQPPEELVRPILRERGRAVAVEPTGYVRPIIDGEVTSYFEWIGAGHYSADQRLGAMHGRRFLVRELHYGTDGASFFLRVDFMSGEYERLPGLEARLTLEAASAARLSLQLGEQSVTASEFSRSGAPPGPGDPLAPEVAFGRVLEVRVPLEAVGLRGSGRVRFQFSLWQESLPLDALPLEGWLELDTSEPAEWRA